eukprot:TRINITY_DN28186_c0_g1_i1.p1 TRINITY_DN28186_c0_g1~~TRINITY_DN28186_c0_g1_i1.p1  ORF type:complete len:1021 (-),score=191.67 TRINITY_DN28186_c0_g1_i1:61-3081(-)
MHALPSLTQLHRRLPSSALSRVLQGEAQVLASWRSAQVCCSFSSKTSPPVRQRGGADATGQAGLWELMESNTQLFNPRKLPSILVPAARLSKEECEDKRLREFLERARKFLDGQGQVLRTLGPSGAAASVQAARRLELPEARNFALALLSSMTSQVRELSPIVLADLAQELLKYRVTDKLLWQAVADSVMDRSDLGPAQLVSLLDSLRRSLAFGFRPNRALEMLCEASADRREEFSGKQLVGVIGSVSRLGNHLSTSAQYKALQLMLDRWLASQAALLEGTQSSQIVSLAVSLTNVSSFLNVRTDNFVAAAAGWALHTAAPVGGVLTAEELIVLLWALKELTSLGLAPHKELLAIAVPRLQAEAKPEGWSLLRLVQSFEVLLASRHALVQSRMGDVPDVTDDCAEDLQTLESMISVALGASLNDASSAMVARVLALWEQAGMDFWSRCPSIAEALVQRTLELASDASVPAAQLHPLLDTISASSLSRLPVFRDAGRAALCAVTASRHDAEDPAMAAALRALEKEHTSEPWSAATTEAAAMQDGAIPLQASADAKSQPVLSPMGLAERLGQQCKQGADTAEVTATSEALLAVLTNMAPDEIVPALGHVLAGGRRRLARDPAVLEVVERIGDQVAAHTNDLSTLQLVSALEWFASVGLPYHLLFESVLLELLDRQRAQSVSWGQAIGVLESFAAVRLRIPELEVLYSYLRRPQELARLPTMALVRFLSAAARLELTDEAGLDSREMVDRILAETTPQRPLPLEESVIIVQSLLLSGTVPPDKQLRHLLTWIAGARVPQLLPQQLAVLRQYSFFLLAQEDINVRGSLLRMPVEMQNFISEMLRHRSASFTPGSSDTTRRFRDEVSELVLSHRSATSCTTAALGVSLGPAGNAELLVDGNFWLLDGPEAFFRPFASQLRYTPQEKRRAWLLQRLLGDDDVRRCVIDFYPNALDWPKIEGPRRLHWLQWGRAASSTRLELLGFQERREPPSEALRHRTQTSRRSATTERRL